MLNVCLAKPERPSDVNVSPSAWCMALALREASVYSTTVHLGDRFSPNKCRVRGPQAIHVCALGRVWSVHLHGPCIQSLKVCAMVGVKGYCNHIAVLPICMGILATAIMKFCIGNDAWSGETFLRVCGCSSV